MRVWQFHKWKKRLRETGAAQFLEVKVRPAAVESRQAAAASGQGIEIQLNRGRSLVVGQDSMRSICGCCWLC